ncbi:hypothetical protein ACOSP7_030667 [Xanthoceras sorbifolium]
MASFSSASSSMDKYCFYCNTLSDVLRAGWPVRSGNSAMLCDRCASAYEEGTFCYIFHSDTSGWRYCVSCNKDVHCGCIMSVNAYIELDVGGVKCTQCMANDASMGSMSRNAPSQTLEDLQDPSEVSQCVDLSHIIKGSTQGVPSQEDAPSPKEGEQSCEDLPDAADTHFESPEDNEEPQGDASGKIHPYRKYSFEPTEEELLQIKRDSNSVVIPLFEKVLTISDVVLRNGRFVLPKKCALAYLPKLTKPEGFLIKIQDTCGNDWDFNYRFWPNNNSTMYVLEGMRNFVMFHQCKAGDKVTFYRIDPEGKLVMGLRKLHPTSETTTEIGKARNLRTSKSSK